MFIPLNLRDLKDLSEAAYCNNPPEWIGDWKLLTFSDPNAPSGYFGVAYVNRKTNEVVVAHRGTNLDQILGPDGIANAELIRGKTMGQFADADKFFDDVREAMAAQGISNFSLSLTGHSLGGAIAQLQAAARGLTAQTFNAPGVAHMIPDFNARYPHTPIGDPARYKNAITNHRISFDAVSAAPFGHLGDTNTFGPDALTGIGLALSLFARRHPLGFAGQGLLRGLTLYLPHRLGAFDGVLPPGAATTPTTCCDDEACHPEIPPPVSEKWLDLQRFVPRKDPLTLDLDGDGIETVGIDPNNPILFDHDADGVKTATGWVKADDAFLVLDRNGNGAIDNGTELFGDSTPLRGGGNAADGFAALADLDSNHDGRISSTDAQFAGLRLWQDLNQNGISEAGELFTLTQKGIASVTVQKTENNTVLPNGNVLADTGSYTKTDGTVGTLGETGSLGDVDLSENTFFSQFTDAVPLTPEAQALPDMHGSGRVRGLQELCKWKKAA